MIVKLLVGKVFDGGVWAAGDFLSVPDEVGKAWIEAGEAVNKVTLKEAVSKQQSAVSDEPASTTLPFRSARKNKEE